MRTRLGIASLLLWVAATVAAAEPQAPHPGLAPQAVVEIQLRALQRNDDPVPDAGIARTWAFAHPDNKQMTGPLPRFTAMLKGPQYGMLLNHRAHRIEPVYRTAGLAVFRVRVVSADGTPVSLEWRVARVREGKHIGAWMTVGVSPPLRARDAI